MEIVRERLEREFDLDLLVTAPTVAYNVTTPAGEVVEVHNPAEMPPGAGDASTSRTCARRSSSRRTGSAR